MGEKKTKGRRGCQELPLIKGMRENKEKGERHNMVVEFLYKEVMSAKVAETTKGETYKQQKN